MRSLLFALVVVLASLTGACSSLVTVNDPVTSSSALGVEGVPQQEVLTALPLRVRVAPGRRVEHVLVRYRPWGTSEWRQLELSRSGQTWTGEVSCREVSTVTGDTKYVFVALDVNGSVVDGSGSEEKPYVASIVRDRPGGPVGLPGGPIPLKCHDPSDCPPDFPGCPAYSSVRSACHADADCGKGHSCTWDGYCDSSVSEK